MHLEGFETLNYSMLCLLSFLKVKCNVEQSRYKVLYEKKYRCHIYVSQNASRSWKKDLDLSSLSNSNTIVCCQQMLK